MCLPASKSGHSLIIEDLLEKRGLVGATLAEESSLDDMDDMCDDSLYPSMPVQAHSRFSTHQRPSMLEVDEFGTQSVVIGDVLEGRCDTAISAAESSFDVIGDLSDGGLYLNSDYVSTRPHVILGATRAVSAEQSEVLLPYRCSQFLASFSLAIPTVSLYLLSHNSTPKCSIWSQCDISRYHRSQFSTTHEDGTDSSNVEDNDWLRSPVR